MSSSLNMGLALTLIAGLMSGNCMLPMKFSRRWKWENLWLVFSIVSLAILPWALALMLVGHLFEIYGALTVPQLAVPFLFGVGWGIAQVLFGISVQRLGLGLAYAIIVGLGAMLGTLVPLLVQHRAQVSTSALTEISLGVVLMLLGILLSTLGGRSHASTSPMGSQSAPGTRYFVAILIAILCGVMAPMLNFSFAFGQEIAHRAVEFGNPQLHAAYAVWPIGLAGGFLPNVTYSVYLLCKRRSWILFKSAPGDLSLAILMGALWMGAFALYGMSATYLGTLGTSIGWGLFQIFMIMTATLSGVWSGEWTGASRRAKGLLASGLACLAVATSLLAMGNH